MPLVEHLLRPSGIIFEPAGLLSRDVGIGLSVLEERDIIHVAGWVSMRGGYFVAAPPFTPTGEVEELNRTAFQTDAGLLVLAPEVLQAEVGEDGSITFPFGRFTRKNNDQKKDRVGILIMPTEVFARSIVSYHNRKKKHVDIKFEGVQEMVNPKEFTMMLHGQSLHSPEYHSHHKKKAIA